MIEDKNVLAIKCSNTRNEQYALFCDDKGVYHGNDKDGFALLAVLENINITGRPIKIYYHFPYICVTERYGLNAATVNITNGYVLKFMREDYHCDVSSYSIGFLENNGRTLLIHQTQWNRLDITDLETGKLITGREVVYKKNCETKLDKCGALPKMERKNYIDYFHSLLHVSPDSKHFLSNGWIWQPMDNIMCFETERFLKEYELCGNNIEYYQGYCWDRPCTFVGNDMFVIVADRYEVTSKEGVTETGLKESPVYHQLLFYKLSEVKSHVYTYSGYETYDTLPLAYSGKADCDVFNFNEYDEITGGEIYYDSETEHLIVLSEKGAFELNLDGKVIHSNPEMKLSVGNWQYDTIHHSFYRFSKNRIEKSMM